MKRSLLALGACALALFAAPPADAQKVFRYSTSGDVIGMDPHINNEGPTNTMKNNIYEGLVVRHPDLSVHPSLATEWSNPEPVIWRFKLRQGVKFHDGTPFTADDVVFSFARVNSEQSDMNTYVGTVKEVKKIDDFTVDFITKGPDPILHQNLTLFYIMSKSWTEKNNSAKPVRGTSAEIYANRFTNGTGPFKLVERIADTRTVLEPNKEWWGKATHNLARAEFKPIANAATRVAALISGEIDMMYPVPLQDIPKLNQTPGVKVMEGPELRTIFLGFDQARDELLYSNVKGKNPFKDVRVRRAFYQAVNIEEIKRVTMRNAATPTGLMVAPGIVGFDAELNKRYPYDPEAAKKLLAEAGYPNGFEVQLDCPNDRYVNDEAICLAVVPMLARIGVTVKLFAQTKGKHFDKIGLKENRNTSFYMLGWTPGTYDGHNPLYNLMIMKDKGSGSNNSGAYSNPKVEELTMKIAVETDQKKRLEMLKEAFRIHKEDFGHLPLHQQALAWGVRTDKVEKIVQRPQNDVDLRYVNMK
jgi:peptide/nickel transport system substrate-binding protein